MSGDGITFEQLIAPITACEFLDTYFEQQPLLISQPEPRELDILSLADVERLLFSVESPGKRQWFGLVKDGVTYPMAPPLVDGRGDIRPGEILRRYHEGFTIILNQLHKRSGVVADLCRDLEALVTSTSGVQLNGNVTANLYLTPSGSQGFAPHYDNHDVVVVQIGGSKTWTVYERSVVSPIAELERPLDRQRLGTAVSSGKLGVGDVLYIPRGYPHEASTTRDFSMHLTVGIVTATWADLLEAARQLPASLRASLPSDDGRDAGPRASFVESFEELVRTLADRDLMTHALEKLRAEKLSTLFPPPADYLNQINRLGEITMMSRLEKRHGSAHQLMRTDDRLVLHFPGSAIDLPSYIEEALEFVLAANASFVTNELPGLPNDNQRVIVVRHLVGSGFLKAVASDVAP